MVYEDYQEGQSTGTMGRPCYVHTPHVAHHWPTSCHFTHTQQQCCTSQPTRIWYQAKHTHTVGMTARLTHALVIVRKRRPHTHRLTDTSTSPEYRQCWIPEQRHRHPYTERPYTGTQCPTNILCEYNINTLVEVLYTGITVIPFFHHRGQRYRQ